jgi:hypothetical protein
MDAMEMINLGGWPWGPGALGAPTQAARRSNFVEDARRGIVWGLAKQGEYSGDEARGIFWR